MLTGGTAATAAVAGGTALAAYLDGKFHIHKDLSTISRLKKAERGYKKAGTCREHWQYFWKIYPPEFNISLTPALDSQSRTTDSPRGILSPAQPPRTPLQ
jgi:hypothetical protein